MALNWIDGSKPQLIKQLHTLLLRADSDSLEYINESVRGQFVYKIVPSPLARML